MDIKPLIWRRIVVELDNSLDDLHHVIQCAMGWENYHLHEFSCNGKSFVFEGEDALSDTLSSLGLHEGDRFIYIYDFGDNWEHLIEVEEIAEKQKEISYPYCIAGKNACPPEDSGGAFGHQNNLQILKDKNHPEYQHTLSWMGEEYDPKFFDLDEVNRQLAEMFVKNDSEIFLIDCRLYF